MEPLGRKKYRITGLEYWVWVHCMVSVVHIYFLEAFRNENLFYFKTGCVFFSRLRNLSEGSNVRFAQFVSEPLRRYVF